MLSPENLTKITKEDIRDSIFRIINDNLIPILSVLGAITACACVQEYSKGILEIIKNTQ